METRTGSDGDERATSGTGRSDDRSAGQAAGPVGPPTFCAVDSPVSAFLEIPIDGDATFDSIELQYLAPKDQGVSGPTSNLRVPTGVVDQGHFAALVHTPAGVQLYLDPESPLDEDWFANDPAYANLERAGFHRSPVMVTRWEIESDRVEVEASFQLADGQTVHLEVRQEAGKDKVLRQFIPTPAISSLNLLRFLQVEGFGLVRRTSELTVTIDGRSLNPARFALPLGGKRRYAARYAAQCVVIGLNPNGDHPLGQTVSNDLQWTFDPPLTDLALHDADPQQDANQHQQEGTVSFRMGVGQATTARYVQKSTETGHKLALSEVEQGWKPPGRNLQLRVLGALRQLKRKNLTWRWSGTIQAGGTSEPPMLVDSTWTATP